MLDGIATLPQGVPEVTLGWHVLEHATKWLIQPDGPRAGEPWVPTDSQARFTLWWYAVDEDGRWIYHHGVIRRAKGSGKSPFVAVLSLEEFVGPVRLKDFDPHAPGGCVARSLDMTLVQVAATAESQTANTMRMIRQMALKRSRVANHYSIDVGKTVMYTPTGGQLEVITSSAATAEGAQVTFAVEDETEHWKPSTGGRELAATLDRNLAKSSSRSIETANAWEPGTESVAEATYEAWVAQEEGRTQGKSKILYDARIAPADVVLANRKSLMRGLEFVYADCPWVDLNTIIEHIYDPRNPSETSQRYYLNQPTAAEDAWVAPVEWAKLADAGREVIDGEPIVMFFDGSKSRDATGLVGCCMSDGHIFTIGGWEPDLKDRTSKVPVHEIDDAVDNAFEQYEVLGFFADVQEWQGFVKVTWPDRYKDKLMIHAVPGGTNPEAIAWDMRRRSYEFMQETELTLAEILNEDFTHDDNSMMDRHVVNARRRLHKGGIAISKESKDSPRKIDLAVCMIGARMVRRRLMGTKEWQKRIRPKRGPTRIIVLKD